MRVAVRFVALRVAFLALEAFFALVAFVAPVAVDAAPAAAEPGSFNARLNRGPRFSTLPMLAR